MILGHGIWKRCRNLGSLAASRVVVGQLADGTTRGSSCLAQRAPAKGCPAFVLSFVKNEIQTFLFIIIFSKYLLHMG